MTTDIERAPENRHWEDAPDADAVIGNLREQIRAAREALGRHWNAQATDAASEAE